MEAVKVDVRKLQLLNDRISQTLDALNQVRLSAHGLSHSPSVVPVIQQTPVPWALPYAPVSGYAVPSLFGLPQAYGISHSTGIPYIGYPVSGVWNPSLGVTSPVASVPAIPAIPGAVNGLAHTTGVSPYAMGPAVAPAIHPYAASWIAAGLSPLTYGLPNGLAHSSPETVDVGQVMSRQVLAQQAIAQNTAQAWDPYLGLRIAQTFPYAQCSYSPFAAL